MKLVEQYGGVYRLSDRNYERLLRLIMTGQEWDLETIGGALVGHLDARPLHLTPFEAKQRLADLTKKKDKNGPDAVGCT